MHGQPSENSAAIKRKRHRWAQLGGHRVGDGPYFSWRCKDCGLIRTKQCHEPNCYNMGERRWSTYAPPCPPDERRERAKPPAG
jgi:hypothetical protein